MKNSRSQNSIKTKSASTLINVIIIIGLISLVFTLIVMYLNPVRYFAEVNNEKRNSDVIKIINALNHFAADHQGDYPADMPLSGSPAEPISANDADICSSIVPEYLEVLPSDPLAKNEPTNDLCPLRYNTGYTIFINPSDNKITIAAPLTEEPLTTQISVTR